MAVCVHGGVCSWRCVCVCVHGGVCVCSWCGVCSWRCVCVCFHGVVCVLCVVCMFVHMCVCVCMRGHSLQVLLVRCCHSTQKPAFLHASAACATQRREMLRSQRHKTHNENCC